MKILVLGAGVVGTTSAWYLAKAGHTVTVVDRQPVAGNETSFANGGQISVSNSEVWTTWSNVLKGIKWIFKKDAPLLIRPRLDWAQWKWITKFLYYTAKGVYKENTAKTVQMGLASRDLYKDICQEEGIQFDRSACGILHFYKDRKYWSHAQEARFLYVKNGLERNMLDANFLENTDPALKDIKDVVGATLTPTDWTGDIHKFCYELAEVLKNKYGVEFKFNSSVTDKYGVKGLTELFDAVVIAAGVGSVELGKQINDSLPVYPVKGYSITINNVDPKHLPKVSLLDDQAKIVTASLGNRFRVAGTAELAGENYDITRNRIQPLLDWVHTNFPNINTHDYSQYACLRPMTPNMMPILKQSDKNKKVFYNTGHGHLGWTLGPYTGKTVTDLIKAYLNEQQRT